jgi:hypothetical protein
MTWLRDLLRGYTDADLRSARRKVEHPDGWDDFTAREWRAYLAFMREMLGLVQ